MHHYVEYRDANESIHTRSSEGSVKSTVEHAWSERNLTFVAYLPVLRRDLLVSRSAYYSASLIGNVRHG